MLILINAGCETGAENLELLIEWKLRYSATGF